MEILCIEKSGISFYRHGVFINFVKSRIYWNHLFIYFELLAHIFNLLTSSRFQICSGSSLFVKEFLKKDRKQI